MSATTKSAWAAVLPSAMGARALSVAQEVAGRMRDPRQVRVHAENASRQSDFAAYRRWRPSDVAQGDAGLALLFGYLDACLPGDGWDVCAHEYLSLAAHDAQDLTHVRPSLFGGIAGVAFAAHSLSRDGSRYRRLLGELDRWLAPQAAQQARGLEQAGAGVPVGAFDVIAGLAGTGAYLLCRRHEAGAARALEAVLAGLVALCGDRDGLPNWHTPIGAMGADEPMARQFPHGNLNCGLAHGIPGPLALMSLATRAGITVPGQREAVHRVADWLVEHRADDEWGANWPSAFALPCPDSPPEQPRPGRSAWCYGSPGVARALWLAGSALDAPQLCALAVEAMAATYRRPRGRRFIDSPTFCHGVAGLLQITTRFAHDTGDPMFGQAAADLTEQILRLYQPDLPLGFSDLEPGGNRVDQPGLLDGAPGVALALLAAATDVPPAWDRLFLLS
ncbi:lanthionine synthetase C family protein [Nonomuraea guangzhouensis]|uniref:Lanthionine synthetase C family protein n=1 Tax=Nonomuraea guangzhouensis TaxID=1291555 RepID=A0ABW4GSK7_9ACTN|nr:lanthionine synthetase C family protein [Nonomuraea guangzhouensis]